VTPSTKTQVVQNLEGGIVSEIFIAEGDTVERDQPIARMDETSFQSSYQELQEQSLALKIRLERLLAEKSLDTQFSLNHELVELAPEYADSETALFEARREQLALSLQNLEELVALKDREVEMLRPMAERGAISSLDLIRAEQATIDARSRLTQTSTEFETARSTDYSEALVSLRQIEEQMRAREDQLRRTNVTSPVRGIINKVLVNTMGAVVQPGQPLIEILPLEEDLRVEGRVDPRDIGFVFVGMPANIKLSAYDFSIYGTLQGEVIHVGADSLQDETQPNSLPYFEVIISLITNSLEGPNGVVSIRPGMQADIELVSGKKTVLEYLLKPLFKANDALTER
jgi:adhesin transport system membrane fusion protein